MIPAEAVEAAAEFVVYGGNGHRKLRTFATRQQADEYAADFERKCWSQGVPVPRSIIREDK